MAPRKKKVDDATSVDDTSTTTDETVDAASETDVAPEAAATDAPPAPEAEKLPMIADPIDAPPPVEEVKISLSSIPIEQIAEAMSILGELRNASNNVAFRRRCDAVAPIVGAFLSKLNG